MDVQASFDREDLITAATSDGPADRDRRAAINELAKLALTQRFMGSYLRWTVKGEAKYDIATVP
ncbi:hypothetical protein Tdes44962_MAKER10274 [Teratosphaeria destructans]|uniref:Uncharacterized protein n=1 Tax=Teratosphaeria destructans TaxID=418781 RepID=A0A9W7SLR4_9PEZI|nr:hypothetical protein Tdes44962_MAKER10274 [Teratosphaeria destructans]